MAKRLSSAKPEAHHYKGSSLDSAGSYRLSVATRSGSGAAELHRKANDVFVVESGEAMLIIGGSIVNAKTTTANEVRGASIEGGTRHKLGPGDIVHIPANTPHQILLEEGKQITYAVMKVDAR